MCRRIFLEVTESIFTHPDNFVASYGAVQATVQEIGQQFVQEIGQQFVSATGIKMRDLQSISTHGFSFNLSI